MFDPQSLFAGFVSGVLTASVLWLIWTGLVMSQISEEMHQTRMQVEELSDEEKDEIDDILAKHWEQPWSS